MLVVVLVWMGSLIYYFAKEVKQVHYIERHGTTRENMGLQL